MNSSVNKAASVLGSVRRLIEVAYDRVEELDYSFNIYNTEIVATYDDYTLEFKDGEYSILKVDLEFPNLDSHINTVEGYALSKVMNKNKEEIKRTMISQIKNNIGGVISERNAYVTSIILDTIVDIENIGFTYPTNKTYVAALEQAIFTRRVELGDTLDQAERLSKYIVEDVKKHIKK